MNNDLISRENLNKTIDKITWYHINSDGDLVEGAFEENDAFYKAEDIFNAIDNVPTAEVTKPQSYVMGFCDGLKAQTYEKPSMFERPQGEWTVFYTPKKKKVFKCDKCMAVSIQGQTNFCHNCGAKMRKGGAE